MLAGTSGPPARLAAEASGDRLAVLLGAIAEGDRSAFRELYDLTSSKLFGIAVTMLRSREATQDVLQEAYLRVWSRAKTYDPGRGEAMPWLARILRNLAVDRLAKDRVAHEDIDSHAEKLEAGELPSGDRIDTVRCLATLGRGQRIAVVLTYLHGYTNDEIARCMNVPLGTVKSWIRRGAQQLRTQLEA